MKESIYLTTFKWKKKISQTLANTNNSRLFNGRIFGVHTSLVFHQRIVLMKEHLFLWQVWVFSFWFQQSTGPIRHHKIFNSKLGMFLQFFPFPSSQCSGINSGRHQAAVFTAFTMFSNSLLLENPFSNVSLSLEYSGESMFYKLLYFDEQTSSAFWREIAKPTIESIAWFYSSLKIKSSDT